MIEPDFVIKRRDPVPAQTFACVGCQRDINLPLYRFDTVEAPPLCRWCQWHWSKGFGANVQGVTRGERRHMERVIALVALIQWEAKNASHAQ